MRILLSGFEPFGGSRVNPSQRLVEHLVPAWNQHPPALGVELNGVILPVDDLEGPRRLIDAVELRSPDAVICFGESSRATSITIERVFINLRDYRIPDNTGRRVRDQPIDATGPAAYFSTLPVRAMADAIEAAGVPGAAALSTSAGAFLCNQVAYALLHHLATCGRPIPAGFIHLPRLPEQDRAADRPHLTMALEDMVRGVRAAVHVLTQHIVF